MADPMKNTITPYDKLTMLNVKDVGGKNASLGEMITKLSSRGIRVPNGFAVNADAYFEYLKFNGLTVKIEKELKKLDVENFDNLSEISSECKGLILKGQIPSEIEISIREAYEQLIAGSAGASVAVRSSATAEDSPNASFAGQHESFLNVKTADDVMDSVKKCYASMFNERAIKYRIDNKFVHMQVGQSVGVQLMVRSDKGSAGVIFTIEPENGNKNLIYLTGAWGLGESVVQGAVNTDEFYFFKPAIGKGPTSIVYRTLGSKSQMVVYDERSIKWINTPVQLRDHYCLSDEDLETLGSWSLTIEQLYNTPMDIEWAKDGVSGELFIVQARPETVQSNKKSSTIREYKLESGNVPILKGKAVGRSIVSGKVRIVTTLADSHKVNAGDIIVADITNPDWNALLKKAICIVTNKGGRTSHASIIARELGVPAVVGTLTATDMLKDGQIVTVSCSTGDEGEIYEGKLKWKEREIVLDSLSETRTAPMLILADPKKSLLYAQFPNSGVGLLRMEFMISNTIGVHPMALAKFDALPDTSEKRQIEAITRHYSDKKLFFIDKLAESIGLVAAAFYPRQVIVRMSDFKTNEYAKLLGGKYFEPEEENPMLGFRGASRYYHERYTEGFQLECLAVRKVREEMKLSNVKVMIPFCRTIDEGRKVLETMERYGLKRKDHGLEVYVMAEIPSNILLAEEFAKQFDGFSIGSNDLTQLTLGLDRDSAIVSHLFNENDPAVKQLIQTLITKAHASGVKVGLCGQAPSDYPEFAKFLVECGIDSISFNPDALIQGIQNIVLAEAVSEGSLQIA